MGEVLKPALSGLSVAGAVAVKGLVHGVVGGALSMSQGGSFMEGFAANAIGAGAGVLSGGTAIGSDMYVDTAFVALAGGLAAEITGGKFSNGAITAGFAHMFNAEAHREGGIDERDFERGGIQQSYFLEEAALLLTAPVRAVYLMARGGFLAVSGVAAAETGFFQGSRYTQKVLEQMKNGADKFHSFPESVTAFEGAGTVRESREVTALFARCWRSPDPTAAATECSSSSRKLMGRSTIGYSFLGHDHD